MDKTLIDSIIERIDILKSNGKIVILNKDEFFLKLDIDFNSLLNMALESDNVDDDLDSFDDLYQQYKKYHDNYMKETSKDNVDPRVTRVTQQINAVMDSNKMKK
jgi:hypothetical protein